MNSKLRERIRLLGTDPDRVSGTLGTGLGLAMELYFSSVTPSGSDVMTEDWDQLILLDGCRYDTFERQNVLDGELSVRHSLATETPEFLSRTFEGTRYPDTVYVTANPIHRVSEWCDVDLDETFHAVVDVWREDWNDSLGTVPPAEMSAAVRRARARYPNRRLIAHFIQPHYPFIGPTGRRLDHGRLNGKSRAEGQREADGSADDETPIWRALRDGEFPPARVRRAYEENLWLTLPYVQSLLAAFDGTTVVTTDHGNHLGGISVPFPVRMYGHPPGVRTPELTRVPWLRVQGDRSADGRVSAVGDDLDWTVSPRAKNESGPTSDRDERHSGDGTIPEDPTESERHHVREGPLVSVVVPTHYRNEKLACAIESVLMQRYEPIEIIVVDDSGEAHARPVADEYDVSYIPLEENRKANVARTVGIEQSNGEYVQLLDDDDCLHPEKFARQVATLKGDPDVDVTYCGWASDHGLRRANPDARGDVLEAALQFGPKSCTTSTLLTAAPTLLTVTPLQDRDGADDIGLVIELASRTEFEVDPLPLVYRSASGDRRSKKSEVGRELLTIVEEYDSLYAEYPPSLRQTALKKAYQTLGYNLLQERGWSSEAVAAFWKSSQYSETTSIAQVGSVAAALLGSPGYRLASRLNSSLRS